MSIYNINGLLKQLRKTSGYSVSKVTELLKTYYIDIAPKTLYGYECGSNTPNIHTFLALCQIYNCSDPLALLNIPAADKSEIAILQKYRKLDAKGKELVSHILDFELKRTQDIQYLQKKLSITEQK